jgi:peptidoglycan-associated lipoprotein
LLLPFSAYAFPAGGGSISYFLRHSEQEFSSLPTLKTDESLLRLDLFQVVPGYGRLFTSVDQTWSDTVDMGSTNSLSRYQFGIEGFRAGSRLYSLTGGDTVFRFTNLVESFSGPFTSILSIAPPIIITFQTDPSRFTNATYGDVNIRGALLESSGSKDRLILLGGRLSIPSGFQGNTFTVLDETLYGGLWGRQWSDRLRIGAGLLQTTRQPIDNGAETVDNTIFLLDGSYRLSPAVRLVGELKENIFSRDSGGDGSGMALKAGSFITLPRTTLEFNYRRTDPDFVFVRETLQTERDTEGIYASAEYKPRADTTLYTTVDWNRNNLDNRQTIADITSLSILLGGYLFNPAYPTLSLRLSLTDRSSRGGETTPSDTTSYAAYGEVSRPFPLATPYLRFTAQRQEEKGGSSQPSNDSGSLLLGARTYQRGVSVYLEGEQQLKKTDGGDTTDGSRIRGGLSTTLFSRLNLYLDGEYATTRDNTAGTRTDTISTGAGATLTLPGGYLLAGDIRYAESDLDAQTASQSSNLQASLTFIKRFGWGAQPSYRGGQLGTSGQLVETGEIEGFVYQDLNRNGQKDPGEPGVAGMTVLLEDGSTTRSDPQGRYRFPSATAGIHQVRFSERELPASFNLLAQPLQRVEVGLRQTVAVHFPLIVSGSITGRVLSDVNGNGIADEGDVGVPDVLVYLRGTQTNGFTDPEGVFAFENLPPASYEAVMDTANLPEGMTAVSPESQQIEVTSAKETSGVLFLLAQQKREVVRKVFGQKTAQSEPAAAVIQESAPLKAEKTAQTPRKNSGAKKKKPAAKVKTAPVAPPAVSPEPAAAVTGEAVAATTKGPQTEETLVLTIHFDSDSTRFSSKADTATIHTAAQLLLADPLLAAAIEGHCDQRGSDAHNARLGKKRAEAVAQALIASGVEKKRIEKITGFGKTRPLCTEPEEACHRQNRRSHIRIILVPAKEG